MTYTVSTLAEHWDVSESLIRKLIATGELRCFRPGNLIRIAPEEVERFQATASSASRADTPSSGGTMKASGTAIDLRPLTALELKVKQGGFGRQGTVRTGPWAGS